MKKNPLRDSRAVIIPLSHNGVVMISCTAEKADEIENNLRTIKNDHAAGIETEKSKT